eukprot:scaffold742_cov165-Amphora_coffeaeformis.AAC.11
MRLGQSFWGRKFVHVALVQPRPLECSLECPLECFGTETIQEYTLLFLEFFSGGSVGALGIITSTLVVGASDRVREDPGDHTARVYKERNLNVRSAEHEWGMIEVYQTTSLTD